MFSCSAGLQNTEELLSACFRQLWDTSPSRTERPLQLPSEDPERVHCGQSTSAREELAHPGKTLSSWRTHHLYLGGLTLPERTHSIWEDSFYLGGLALSGGTLSTQKDSVSLGEDSLYLGGLALPGRTLSVWKGLSVWRRLSLRERTHSSGRTHSTWEDSVYLGGVSLPGRTLSLSGRTHLPGKTPCLCRGGPLYCSPGWHPSPRATPCWGCVLRSLFSASFQHPGQAGAIDEESAGMGLGPFTHQVKDCGPGNGGKTPFAGVTGKVWRGRLEGIRQN